MPYWKNCRQNHSSTFTCQHSALCAMSVLTPIFCVQEQSHGSPVWYNLPKLFQNQQELLKKRKWRSLLELWLPAYTNIRISLKALCFLTCFRLTKTSNDFWCPFHVGIHLSVPEHPGHHTHSLQSRGEWELANNSYLINSLRNFKRCTNHSLFFKELK